MLIQLPSGPAGRKGSKDDSGEGFEAALRRDLASAPIVSYDGLLGGWIKRAVDLSLALMTSPVWLPLLGATAAWSRLRSAAPVFITHESVTYAGRVFGYLTLRVARPVNTSVEDASIDGIEKIAQRAEPRLAKWRRVLERLPQMFSVIAGDMSLVGPLPLSRVELEPLKSARRYYLSMRPGVIGIHSVAEAEFEEPSHYKIYALSWSIGTDLAVMWDAVQSLSRRGELWRPGLRAAAKNDNALAAAHAEARRRRGLA